MPSNYKAVYSVGTESCFILKKDIIWPTNDCTLVRTIIVVTTEKKRKFCLFLITELKETRF